MKYQQCKLTQPIYKTSPFFYIVNITTPDRCIIGYTGNGSHDQRFMAILQLGQGACPKISGEIPLILDFALITEEIGEEFPPIQSKNMKINHFECLNGKNSAYFTLTNPHSKE